MICHIDLHVCLQHFGCAGVVGESMSGQPLVCPWLLTPCFSHQEPGSYIASSSCVLQAGDGNRRRQLWLISSIGQGDEKPSLPLPAPTSTQEQRTQEGRKENRKEKTEGFC